MKMTVARVPIGSAVPVLLVALLACAVARVAVVVEGGACDAAFCGIGTCTELPPPVLPVPAFECDCEAGWARVVPALGFTPCFIPNCQSDLNCYLPTLIIPPIGGNITQHPCLFVDCGREGTCVEGDQEKPFFHCQCNSGATNLLNNTSFPCTKNCKVGDDGCPIPNPPPPPPPPPPSSVGNPTVPTSPGSVCLQNLLLLASLAALYIA